MKEPRFHERAALYAVVGILAFAGVMWAGHRLSGVLHDVAPTQTAAQKRGAARPQQCVVGGQVEDPCYSVPRGR